MAQRIARFSSGMSRLSRGHEAACVRPYFVAMKKPPLVHDVAQRTSALRCCGGGIHA